MRATLIEVDAACPPGYWYSILAGQRLWAQEGRECAVGDCWLILPGQGVKSHPEPVIFAEHAWTCPLYTSDAAAEEDRIDLGGCRNLPKKTSDHHNTHHTQTTHITQET